MSQAHRLDWREFKRVSYFPRHGLTVYAVRTVTAGSLILRLSIRIGNSMISSDIWHKYHELYFKIVIRNFTSR